MRQIRCRLYKGIKTPKSWTPACVSGQHRANPGGRAHPLSPGTETRTQHSPRSAGARGKGAGACLSRLGVGDPLTVHGAPQQLLHVPCHIHRVFQVKIALGVQHRVGAVGGRR